MNVAGSSDYEAGLKDDERFEQELRQAASSLLLLQNKARINQNKDLRNQSKGLIGEWLQIYSKKRWEETKCSEPTIEKMERDIAEGWKQIIGLLLTELQHQMSESTEELNKATKKRSESIRIDKGKAKEFADRVAVINQQVQTDDVNFEQASGYAMGCNGCGG